MVENNSRQHACVPDSIRNSKFVYVRHARSEGNEGYLREGEKAYFDISLKDAPLSEGGIQECLTSATKHHLEQLEFRTIVVSPLRRCLQTAYYLLKDHPKFNEL